MVHRRMRSAPFRSCSGNANVNYDSRLGTGRSGLDVFLHTPYRRRAANQRRIEIVSMSAVGGTVRWRSTSQGGNS